MKTIVVLFIFVLPLFSVAQFQTKEEVIVTEEQNDDMYLAGEKVVINARIEGDLVTAGGEITVKDSIGQDLIAAGGKIILNGSVDDDIRIAGGSLTIDNKIGDDLVAVGGEITITDDVVISGNLISCAGDFNINGKIRGEAKVCGGDVSFNGKIDKDAVFYAGDLTLNGEVRGTSKIVAETIKIGDNAKFYANVEYWSEDGEVDFKNSLVNASATFNKDLAPKERQLPWGMFGVAAIGVWIFYILSAFLVILIFNYLFKKIFSSAIEYLDKEILKTLGYGIGYLIGVPILILLTFVIIIGIPLGLFLTLFYAFSLVFGHLVVALLVTYYLNNKNETSWNFWTIVLLALAIAVGIRLLTLIPILGVLISLISIAIGYGAIVIALLKNRTSLKTST